MIQNKTYCSVSWWYFGYFLPALSNSFFFRFFDSLFGTFSSWSFVSLSSLSVSSSFSSFSESEGSSEGSLIFSGSLEGWVLMKNVLFSSISSLDFSCEFSFSAKGWNFSFHTLQLSFQIKGHISLAFYPWLLWNRYKICD